MTLPSSPTPTNLTAQRVSLTSARPTLWALSSTPSIWPWRRRAARFWAIRPSWEAAVLLPSHRRSASLLRPYRTVEDTRAAIINLYFLVMIALLAAYALVAIALEVFVLPQNVYRPIRRLLAADQAVQEGRQADEIIPREAIPSDELGEIMQSRTTSSPTCMHRSTPLPTHSHSFERVANDLARKNHLLEAARRNLADADRLASLGMMSAGIAHELNTPLAVLKGMVERLAPSSARACGARPSRADGPRRWTA